MTSPFSDEHASICDFPPGQDAPLAEYALRASPRFNFCCHRDTLYVPLVSEPRQKEVQ
jgi:hypothetical protein